jgi:hypothetical protein
MGRCMGRGAIDHGELLLVKPPGGDQALQHRACIMKRSVSFVVARQGKAGWAVKRMQLCTRRTHGVHGKPCTACAVFALQLRCN